MPFKSEAQRRKFQELAKQGKIKKSVVQDFERASRGMRLPERVAVKKQGGSNSKARKPTK